MRPAPPFESPSPCEALRSQSRTRGSCTSSRSDQLTVGGEDRPVFHRSLGVAVGVGATISVILVSGPRGHSDSSLHHFSTDFLNFHDRWVGHVHRENLGELDSVLAADHDAPRIAYHFPLSALK